MRVNTVQAPALLRLLMPAGSVVTLEDLLRDPRDRTQELECQVLYLARDDDSTVTLPSRQTVIQVGDRLLLVGRGERRARTHPA